MYDVTDIKYTSGKSHARILRGDGEKDTIVRGFWRRICGLFAEQIRKRRLYLIRL